MAKKGKFKPIHPERYKGDPTNIVWRSSYELKFMFWADTNSRVKWWSSEEKSLPYFDKSRGHPGRYFPDFMVCFDNDQTFMVEVKPFKQTQKPVPPKDGRQKSRYLKECATFVKNLCKWEAARKYCEERNWKFQILTEKELGIEQFNRKH